MTVDISKQVAYAVLISDSISISKQVAYVVLQSPFPGVLSPLQVVEPLTDGDSNVATSLIVTEAATGGEPIVRCTLFVVEALFVPAPEDEVITDILPTRSPIGAPLSTVGLRGLSFSVFKRPSFRTQINPAVSGKETRNARMQYPLYEFELTFEFLDNRDTKTEYDQLAGFFMTQRGSFNEWLYQDPTHYMNDEVVIGMGDGGTVDYKVMKSLGGFLDPVGYVDLTALFNFNSSDVDPSDDEVTVTGHGLYTGYGPLQLTADSALPPGLNTNTNYWLIEVDDNTLAFAISKADALAGNRVNITSTGSGGFQASNSLAAFIDGVEVDPGDYTVTLPNTLSFASSPLAGEVVSVSCKYFFVCRFMEDLADFEEFMEKLWKLDTLEFQSVIK